ncbi:TlyA family RNA methyltransferase [Candidatus Symbiobacter mobilis]|uniref:Hemolysin-like protein n=1 Tax=Candidatus Symbiobacter mobilis CR TaxID=946483 RepID=U5NBI1_9BURK|nr:TlyA family RNA methyltransferase [Candidatus Symbiobacter mobilis]AGX87598.1 hemolysin-like protein [Candidatus Symbiobacter mobilis CR]
MRLDQLLVRRGLAPTRAQAQRLIAAGVRWSCGGDWRICHSNAQNVPDDALIELPPSAVLRYVSRAGDKLAAALERGGIDVAGKDCLDVGQSTGGFTDCLLQHGAARVVGVDVGYGQLHERLRADPRVLCIERTNARSLRAMDIKTACGARDFPTAFDRIVIDVSFVSQTLVLPALTPLLRPDAVLVSLAKPQFELQPAQIAKGGIVKDPALFAVVEERLRTCCADLGLRVIDWFASPLLGGDGNQEFLFIATPRSLV